jgi:hypothetical protein
MDVVGWALLAALCMALLTMFAPRWLAWLGWPRWLRGRAPVRLRARHVALETVLAEVGSRRCLAATAALEGLAEQDSETIAETWTRLEGPLLEALPDCPPEDKPRLAEALAECAERCSRRASARSMMLLRNSLLPSAPA